METTLAVLVGLACVASAARAAEPPSVKGTLTANGQTVNLPYVYVYALEKGFYDDADPTWRILFVEHPVEARKLKEPIWDAAYVELGITKTKEFGDKPGPQVYAQNVKVSAKSGSVSGGNYPQIELSSAGPERFAGRIYHAESQKLLDNAIQYDFTFSAPLSDPNAPLGPPLPAGGGEPGKAYRAWVEALHAGDLARLKKLVPPEMASQLDGPEAKKEVEMMASMTPTQVKILGGSSDGTTAILKVEGLVGGEKVSGEVTLEKVGGFWMATRSSW